MPVRRLIFLCIFLGALCPMTLSGQEIDEVREGAAYAHELNQLTTGFGALIERSVGYDDLAYGIVSGQVSQDVATQQGNTLSVQLWSDFTRLSDALRDFPDPPSSVRNARLLGLMSNVRASAETAKETAKLLITSGEDLLQAALSGDADVLTQIEKRNLKIIIVQTRQTVAHLDAQLANTNRASFNFPLIASMKTSYQAVILIMESALEFYDHGSAAALSESLERARNQALALTESGFAFIASGREASRRILQQIERQQSQDPREQRMIEAVKDILRSNIPESFDIEERMMIEISSYAESLGQYDDEEIDAWYARVTILENERARLLLERQRRIAEN